MSYVQWRNSYTFILFTYVSFHFLYWGFTQVCLVELGRCIFSVCMQFRYCLVGSLLVHLCSFIIFLSIWYSTEHCVHL
jgi:hypothetical protein